MGAMAVVVGVIWNDVLCVHFVDEMSSVAKDGSGSWKSNLQVYYTRHPASHLSRQLEGVVMHNFCVEDFLQDGMQILTNHGSFLVFFWRGCCVAFIYLAEMWSRMPRLELFAYNLPLGWRRHRTKLQFDSVDSVEQKGSLASSPIPSKSSFIHINNGFGANVRRTFLIDDHPLLWVALHTRHILLFSKASPSTSSVNDPHTWIRLLTWAEPWTSLQLRQLCWSHWRTPTWRDFRYHRAFPAWEILCNQQQLLKSMQTQKEKGR